MAHTQKKTISGVNASIKEEVTKKFLDFMETPGAWEKGHIGATFGRPINMATGAPYTGMNAITLGIMSPFASKQWVTYKQLDGIREKTRDSLLESGVPESEVDAKLPHVRKGEKGTTAIFAKSRPRETSTRDPDTGAETVETWTSYMYSQFTVFNAEQIENCPVGAKGMEREFEPIAGAELALEALRVKTGLTICHDVGNFYKPSTDEIHLYPKEAWFSEGAYYSCALHEAIHSTLSGHRLDRREALGKRWGDQAYAMEELVAEAGSIFLSMDLGIMPTDDHLKNSAAYMATWRKALSQDPSELFRAVASASKCASYITDLAREHQNERAASEAMACAAMELAQGQAASAGSPGAGQAQESSAPRRAREMAAGGLAP